MQFADPAREAVFLKRYKRFFADVKLGSEVVVSHVANTGSMKGCLIPDAPCIVTESPNPERKIKNSLQFIKTPTSWVGVNTSLPNKLVHELWQSGQIKHWKKFKTAKLEYKLNKETRFDMALAESDEHMAEGRVHHIEVKNVTLAEEGRALFPDSVTERGQKHLRELIQIVKNGGAAEQIYVIQRTDCDVFSPADAIDPAYGKLLRQAQDAGVILKAYKCEIQVEDLKSAAIHLLPTPLKIKL
jgi:sugar fermentation stimulation protein A